MAQMKYDQRALTETRPTDLAAPGIAPPAPPEIAPPAMVAVLQKAILNPIKYDNYKLWHMLSDVKFKDKVLTAAELVRQEKWNTLERYDGNFVTYPETGLFLLNLFKVSMGSDEKQKLINILTSCIKPGYECEKGIITDYSKAYNLLHGSYPSNRTGALYAEYYGHPLNNNNDNNNPCWNMNILAGFISVLGIATVAVAFVALSGTLCTATAITGAAIGVVGLGLFAYNAYKCSQQDTFKESPTLAP